MKSKSIKYAFLALLAALSLLGCRKEFNEITELDLTRCLVPMELEASVAGGDQVTFSWLVTKEVESYTLQISENENFSPSLPDIKIAAADVPFTTQLTVDKTYYWRVKATSSKLEDSKWAKPEPAKASFDTYPVRPSLNPVVVSREKNAVSISWDKAADKTDLTSVKVEPVVPREGEKAVINPITPAEIEACAKKVEGLQAGREYLFTLLFGNAGARGTVTACTRPEMVDGVVSVATAAELVNAIDNATAAVKVCVKYSETPYDLIPAYPKADAQFLTVSSDLYLYGETTEDGKKPVINGANFNLVNGAKVVHLEDLYIDGLLGYGFIVDNASAVLSSFEMINCEMTGYTKGIYGVAEASTSTGADSWRVEGCYAHDFLASGGDFIDIRAGLTKSVVVRNSTFYNCARTFLRFTNNAKIGTVLAENCTFNYVTATPSNSNNSGIFCVYKTTEATSVKALRNVFLNELNEVEAGKTSDKCWTRLCRNSDNSYRVLCEGNVYYNVSSAFFESKAVKAADDNVEEADFGKVAMTKGLLLKEDPCVNSIAGKLYLNSKVGGQIVTLKAGDPRWWNAVQPVVIRETELKPVSDDYTWDFTEKTIYDTEEITVPTIIGNARIFALPSIPAQVTMSEGVSFSQGAVLSGGVPQYSAVGILTSGYGSVKVLAEGVDATVEVVAGGDRYPVLADGVEHTVVLGDLAGENDIYVIADKELTLKKISWTTKLDPEVKVKPLAAPSIVITPAKVEVESTEDVVVSWGAVENAADYVYTWKGAETVTTETGFTIPGAEVAALAVGEYPVAVKARPVPTSTKWLESGVAEAVLKVEKTGNEVTLVWDFNAKAWTDKFAASFTAINNNETAPDFNLDGLRVLAGGGSIKYNVYEGNYFIQTGGAGDKTKRNFQFDAPAPGTLKVYVTNTNDDDKSDRLVNVAVGDGAAVQKKGGFPKKNGPVAVEFDITEAGKVYIYSTGSGLCFYGFEFKYVVPAVEFDWDFNSKAWTDKFAASFTAINNNETAPDFNLDGLRVLAGGGSIKYNVYEGNYFIQTGGAGDKTKRNFQFDAPAPGTLKVYVTNTNDDDKSDRLVNVAVGDGAAVQKKGGFPKKNGPVAVEFDITEAGKVYIYSTGSGLCFYGFHFKGK